MFLYGSKEHEFYSEVLHYRADLLGWRNANPLQEVY